MAGIGAGRGAQRIRRALYEHLIQPFTETYDPIPNVTWGATIGVFVGLLPIMGIQMYAVATLWVLCRYVFRFEFNLAIAIALVWVTNPVTVLPIYFVYLETGLLALHGLGRASDPIDFSYFHQRMTHLSQYYAGDWLKQLVEGTVLLFWEFGWPIVLGSLVWAIPLTVLTYPLTGLALRKYRGYLARSEGLSYEEWTARYIVKRNRPQNGAAS